jgi:hypothetical protein
MKNTHSQMKRSVPVSQTHPVEPANNADRDISQGDSTAPSHEFFFQIDTRLTKENFPDLKMALVVKNRTIDRIPFFTSFFEDLYTHQYGHIAD